MSYATIAPILRGALRIGEAGPALERIGDDDPPPKPAPGADSRTSVILDFSDCPDDAAIAARVGEEFAAVRAGKQAPPSFIYVPGSGAFRVEYEHGARHESSGSSGSPTRPGRLAGKLALVTGGAQGFGEEIVRALVAEGARVFVADLNLAKAEELAAELNAAVGAGSAPAPGNSSAAQAPVAGNAAPVAAQMPATNPGLVASEPESARPVAWALGVDVADEESVEALADRVVELAGGLDLLVSNAGVLRAGSVKSLSKQDFDLVTEVNYGAYFLCVKHFSRLMALQNLADRSYFSDIIQINSKSGLQGSNKNGAYAGGKFGAIGLTQSFAMELVEDKIKVNAICPGNFFEGPLWSDPENGLFVQYLRAGKVPGANTIEDVKAFYEAKVPMGRGCRGEDVARAIFYAVEQKYETGQAIPVTGGQVMLS